MRAPDNAARLAGESPREPQKIWTPATTRLLYENEIWECPRKKDFESAVAAEQVVMK